MKRVPVTDERRSHYRIDDDLHLAYCVIAEGQIWDDEAVFQALFDERSAKHYHITQQLRQVDRQMEDALSTLQQQEPSVHTCLKALSRKIDVLSKEMFLDEPTAKTHANLSVGGLAFETKTPMSAGAQLKLKLLLKPNYDVLLCNGYVVRQEALSSELYCTSVEFVNLTSQQEKLLSRHIMYRQTEQLRKN